MAVLINIYYTGEKDHARRFAAEMTVSGIVEEIRAEKGNLKYEYFFPMEDESTVLLIDHWTDQAALDAHHASPVMQKILALREKYELHMRVERYVAEAGELPEKDRAFVRR